MRKYIDKVLQTHLYDPKRKDTNPILWSDSYKYTQGNMTEDPDFIDGVKQRMIGMYASVEPRKGARDSHVIVAGTQDLGLKLASLRITLEHVHDAIVFCAAHFSTPAHDGRYHFNPYPWLKIVFAHGGILPIKYSAIPDGTIVPVGIPIATIENTDPDCAQMVSHFEPLIMQCLWYPTTCATNALGYSKVIKKALKQTTTPEIMKGWLDFALQCFALRGVTCMEAANVGCGAILYVIKGSDTVPAITHKMKTAGTNSLISYEDMCKQMIAWSVAAIEHNQAMCEGEEGEFKQVKRALAAYPTGILSYVADTFDMRKFVDKVTSGELRDIILGRDGCFVIRPDSCLLDENGSELTPGQTISEILKIMEANLRDHITINSNGFKVLPPQYKIIYGDGLNIPKIEAILAQMILDGWCATNIVFGVGGNFAQRIDRDTERFAMKSSEQTWETVYEDGRETTIEIRNVCKKTPGKISKLGRFHIGVDEHGVPTCYSANDPIASTQESMLKVFNSFESCDSIDVIRSRVNMWREFYGF